MLNFHSLKMQREERRERGRGERVREREAVWQSGGELGIQSKISAADNFCMRPTYSRNYGLCNFCI